MRSPTNKPPATTTFTLSRKIYCDKKCGEMALDFRQDGQATVPMSSGTHQNPSGENSEVWKRPLACHMAGIPPFSGTVLSGLRMSEDNESRFFIQGICYYYYYYPELCGERSFARSQR